MKLLDKLHTPCLRIAKYLLVEEVTHATPCVNRTMEATAPAHLRQHKTKARKSIYFCAKMKLHELPVDVLRCISDFLRTAACSQVCTNVVSFAAAAFAVLYST